MIQSDLLNTLLPEMTAIRRDLHAYPETAFEEHRTSRLVAERLEEYGLSVHCGLAGTGVLGELRSGDGEGAIGLRADMDALDLDEATGLEYVSRHPGKMHACGHDGHTSMLLGAARYLAQTRDFEGTVYFLFQPAEENMAGARVMVEEGLFERFPMQAIFGLHNRPGLAVGKMGVGKGPIMASADFFELELTGVGGHGAYPHKARDPVLTAAHLITAWQTIVSRHTDPLESAVISVTQIHGGRTSNVIPETLSLSGTARAFKPQIQDLLEANMRQMAECIAAAHGLNARFSYDRRYLATVNSDREVDMAIAAMRETVGDANLQTDIEPTMGAEDFGWLLNRCPGAYVIIGNGTEGAHGCALHNPRYDFNDTILPVGVAYWVNLVHSLL